jgi:hypothetical protein
MKGIEEMIFAVKSGFAYFYCESQEINKTVVDITKGLTEYFDANQNGIQFAVSTWDFEETTEKGESKYNSPDEMLLKLENVQNGFDEVPPGTVIVAKNFNWFLSDDYGNCDKSKTSWLLNRSAKFSSAATRKILIIIGNVTFDKAIPEVLRRDFAHIEFALPDEKEIESVYDFIVEPAKKNPKFVTPDR